MKYVTCHYNKNYNKKKYSRALRFLNREYIYVLQLLRKAVNLCNKISKTKRVNWLPSCIMLLNKGRKLEREIKKRNTCTYK